MPSDNQKDLATRAVEIFDMNGGSYRDYVLVTDINPARIVKTSPRIELLTLEDEVLEEVCRQVLIINKAPTFGNFDEFKKVYGMHHNRESGWLAYESPSGFYMVEHPADWRIRRDKNILNIFPPEGSDEITISAFHNVPLTTVNGLIERTFKDYQVVSPLSAISQNNWDGLQGEFLQTVETGLRSWLVIGARYKKVLVFITTNDTQEAMQSLRPFYEFILSSLTLTGLEDANG
jgi:hypothetical protein